MSETTEPQREDMSGIKLLQPVCDHWGNIRWINLQFSRTQIGRVTKTEGAHGWTWDTLKAALFNDEIERPTAMMADVSDHVHYEGIHYALDGSHLNHLSPEKKSALLANDELHTEFNRDNYRMKAFHAHLLHLYTLAPGSSLSSEAKELYFALLTQWAVVGFDKTNFSDETKWAVIQKIQGYSFIDFQADQLAGSYQDVTPTTLSKPASETPDWVLRYPDTNSEGNRIIGSNSDMLGNSGSAYENGTNYARALYLLNFGLKAGDYGNI